ncbi:MAG: hypothetical protein MIL41_11525 [Hyphomicrobiales bacterium]|jgi:hypothetical protein
MRIPNRITRSSPADLAAARLFFVQRIVQSRAPSIRISDRTFLRTLRGLAEPILLGTKPASFLMSVNGDGQRRQRGR